MTRVGHLSNKAGHALYVLGLTALVLQLPPVVLDPASTQFVLLLGGVGLWRYSWGALHFVRSLIYRLMVFPRWRRAADAIAATRLPPHIYLLVTSFRIDSETTRRVYRSVIEEAVRYGAPATVVASVVEMADQRLMKALFNSLRPPAHVRLICVRVAGTGKRDGLASAFRAISMHRPPPGAIAAVIDGDSMLTPGLLAKCVPFFALRPKLGALTTDEICEVEGRPVFRNWYSMRFAQRHIGMSSVGLSRRVLTLTGRMSMFRADLLTDPTFIAAVEMDWIDHWRLGRFRFLTGDDKSSWFWMLKRGYEMLYIPDALVVTIETPPDPSFHRAAVVLMRRWFGNMLRTNARAIMLGPKPMGLFTWWCVVDQRLSMWTTLIGPVGVVLATFLVTPFALIYYIAWIGFTRYVLTLSLLSARKSVSAAYPFLLYYNQIVGSVVKTVILFRLDRQRWTRQKTTADRNIGRVRARWMALSSAYMHGLSLVLLIVVVTFLLNILTLPDVGFWQYRLGI
ncbi:MAG: glycosyltransferase [Alphaproteobacteria bacterium]